MGGVAMGVVVPASLQRRSLAELTSTDEPAWPKVQQWIAEAKNDVVVVPVDRAFGERALVDLQVTVRSPMGAIVYHSGGLLVDHGWLRILGSGGPALPRSLPDWNVGRTVEQLGEQFPVLLVADDAVGGFFAVNGGAFDGPPGNVFFFDPCFLEWVDLGGGYTHFLLFALSGDLESFYTMMRWPTWRDEVEGLSGDTVVNVFPFLCADGPPLAERSRKPVPISQQWSFQVDMLEQMRKLFPEP